MTVWKLWSIAQSVHLYMLQTDNANLLLTRSVFSEKQIVFIYYIFWYTVAISWKFWEAFICMWSHKRHNIPKQRPLQMLGIVWILQALNFNQGNILEGLDKVLLSCRLTLQLCLRQQMISVMELLSVIILEAVAMIRKKLYPLD